MPTGTFYLGPTHYIVAVCSIDHSVLVHIRLLVSALPVWVCGHPTVYWATVGYNYTLKSDVRSSPHPAHDQPIRCTCRARPANQMHSPRTPQPIRCTRRAHPSQSHPVTTHDQPITHIPRTRPANQIQSPSCSLSGRYTSLRYWNPDVGPDQVFLWNFLYYHSNSKFPSSLRV